MYLKEIVGSLGSELAGKKIALCVTASVSIAEAPKIARLLMRHGAEVFTVMTPNASELVSPMIFEWSTGNPPITKLTGRVEHVELVTSKRVDLVLVAPCTANTMGKIAAGICDEPVSTFVCTALGAGIPIVIAGAMHEPMHRNPMVQEARTKLETAHVIFIEGNLVESKSKLAQPEKILESVVSIIGTRRSTGRFSSASFLITAGATREPIDDVRYITNASSGKMGIALAEVALSEGAKKVCLIAGPDVAVPDDLKRNSGVRLISVGTSEEMMNSVLENLRSADYDIMISAAAVSDYAPSSKVKGKISTVETPSFDLKLVATKKIVSTAKQMFPKTLVVAFKAEQGYEGEDLKKRMATALESYKVDVVVGNNVARKDIGFGSDYNEVCILTRDGNTIELPRATKREIAQGILQVISEFPGQRLR